MTDEEKLDIVREIHETDACEICHGEKGGVPGNENILTIDGVKKIACDYCTAALDNGPRGEPVPRPGPGAKFIVEPIKKMGS